MEEQYLFNPWHVHSFSSKQNKCLASSSALSRMCTRKREWREAREKRNGDDGEKKVVRKRGKKSGIVAKFPPTYARMRIHAKGKEKTWRRKIICRRKGRRKR